MPTDKPRLAITLTEEEKKKVEDYRHAHRLSSLSRAIIELVERGLDIVEGGDTPAPKPIPKPEPELTPTEKELLRIYNAMNLAGKRSLMNLARMHTMNPDYQKDTLSKMA